jgi:hypothetical protein
MVGRATGVTARFVVVVGAAGDGNGVRVGIALEGAAERNSVK